MSEIHSIGYSSTIRKRALGRLLTAAREALGLTTTYVCAELGWSASTLNRIEKAKWTKPNTDHVVDLCELYGIHGAERDALVALTREARERGWWTKYNDVFKHQIHPLPGFEAGASRIRTVQLAFIPGLLQERTYTDWITRAAGIDKPAEITRHVDARMARQKILTRDEPEPCRLHAVIDESAILRITDPGIRAAQVRHLLVMTERPNIDVQIRLIADGVYPGKAAEAFVYLDFPDPADRDIVYLETTIDDRLLEERDELLPYIVVFDRLCATAQSPDATRAYLSQQIE